MLKNICLVFVGGGLGCVSRYLISRLTVQFYNESFPVGTIVSNLLSCVLVALLVYSFSIKADQASRMLFLLLITGYCGGLSTFSTFSYETFELLKQGYFMIATFNIVLSVTVGIGALFFIYKQT